MGRRHHSGAHLEQRDTHAVQGCLPSSLAARQPAADNYCFEHQLLNLVGPHASDLIQEATMALTLEATLDEFDATIHPHPTLTEALAEAALAAEGRALHI